MNFVFDKSLVLYLPLYRPDGSSFMSRDACGHLCTVTGAAWRQKSRYFDGTDDSINCGNNTVLDITNNYTIELWLCLDNITGWKDVICKRPATNDEGYVLLFANGSSAPVLYHYITAWTGTACDTSIALKEFTHIVVIKNGTSVTYFLNGGQRNTVTISGTPTTTNADLIIGRWMQGAANPFAGMIGEVRMYSRALTPQEIQHNYLATKWRYQ
ncbi:MAG: LamG domain-containing protein [Dehalococcoidales bacterium]|nr:LamG domain-containing protein [Dehalococcoidales bacterium]